MFAFLRQIRAHPIYQRETGKWGQPNPAYQTVTKYAWLIVFAIPVLFLTNSLSPTNLFGSGEFAFLFVLACLPNLALQVITWIGLIAAPAMTAPSIVGEIKNGSWDILRLTPIKVHELVLAKLLGGLANLKIWIPLALISALQILLLGAGIGFSLFDDFQLISFGSGLIGMVAFVLRPWLEIGFAGLVGITISLWANSIRSALVTSYAIIVFTKVILANVAALLIGWLLFDAILPGLNGIAAGLALLMPILLYLVLGGVLIVLIFQRSAVLANG